MACLNDAVSVCCGMSVDASELEIWANKPRGRVACGLAEMGVSVRPLPDDWGAVDRFVLSERLAVERRTGSSFVAGIMDKSLFTSAIYLREHFDLPILIVEGEVNYEYSMFAPRAVRGAMTSMLIQYGLSVLSTRDAEESIELLSMMTQHEQCGVPDISLIPKRKAADLADLQRRVVEMLPGCGMVLARDMLQALGSVERIVRATPAELRQLKGVGPKKADEMHQVLHGEYRAVDTERNLEDAIEVDPGLLFEIPVKLLARQHVVFSEGGEKHVVDMVFESLESEEDILVELKRGKLRPADAEQLRRYLDHAAESRLLGARLARGRSLRGLLATVEEGGHVPRDRRMGVRIVARERVIEVLERMRAVSPRDGIA